MHVELTFPTLLNQTTWCSIRKEKNGLTTVLTENNKHSKQPEWNPLLQLEHTHKIILSLAIGFVTRLHSSTYYLQVCYSQARSKKKNHFFFGFSPSPIDAYGLVKPHSCYLPCQGNSTAPNWQLLKNIKLTCRFWINKEILTTQRKHRQIALCFTENTQRAVFMNQPSVVHSTANPWVQFLSPKWCADLSMLPSRKTETSSASFHSGTEQSECMAPGWSLARERQSASIVQRLLFHNHKDCTKEREFPEELQ